MNVKKNNQNFGLILGFLLPIVTFFIFFIFNYEAFGTIVRYWEYIVNSGILTKLSSLSLIPNLLLFFVFMKNNAMFSARGVVMATFLHGFVVIGLYAFL